jgi:hypothetical protein
MKQYICTIIFGLLILGHKKKNKETYYYVGLWSERIIQRNNPNLAHKNMYFSSLIRINGEKVNENYNIGGLEINPEILNSRKDKRF